MSLHGSCTILGTTYPNAYIKVSTITGGSTGWSAVAQIFPSAPDQNTTPSLINTIKINYSYEAGIDPVVTAYENLLLIQEFRNMVSDETKILSNLAFLQKFTAQERQTLYTVARTNAAVEDYIKQMNAAKFIDISRSDTIAGVRALETAGLLQVGRADIILTTTI